MAGRIEIPIEEYNSLRNNSSKLEKIINSLSKENMLLKEELEKKDEFIYNIKETTIFDRIFKWKNIFDL